MPLDTASLGSALSSLFADPPHERPACVQAWVDAVQGYVASVVPASTTVTAAASALGGALDSAFTSEAAAPAMESAFASFAATVAGGMAAAGFTGVPPAGPVGFAELLSTVQNSRDAAAAAWASKIDTWMRTGTATLIAPPNTVVPWS